MNTPEEYNRVEMSKFSPLINMVDRISERVNIRRSLRRDSSKIALGFGVGLVVVITSLTPYCIDYFINVNKNPSSYETKADLTIGDIRLQKIGDDYFPLPATNLPQAPK